jgi:hypothetical protein
VQASQFQGSRKAPQGGSIGGHRQLHREPGETGNQSGQLRPYGRFAAGQPHRSDTEALYEDPGDTLDFVESKDLGAREPIISSCGMQ